MISHPGSSGAIRNISRSKRFTLFLITAFPTRRLIENPHLEKASWLGNALIASKPFAQELALL